MNIDKNQYERIVQMNLSGVLATGLSLNEYLGLVRDGVKVAAIREAKGNKSRAARLIGVHRNRIVDVSKKVNSYGEEAIHEG